MPRPKNGYVNAAGEAVPGAGDPISRFMDQTALKVWAWKQGKEGKSLYDRGAIDTGTCVHTMIELDLQSRRDDDIRFFVEQTLKDPGDLAKANAAFAEWRAWRTRNHIQVLVQEIPLVSEKHQYGGTPDLIGVVGNGLALLDFKTSAKGDVYPDMLVKMAAHGKLWTENNPDKPLSGGYHLIILPKDGSGFRHYHYPELKPQWRLFKTYLKAYRLDKECSAKDVLAGGRVKPPVEAPKPAPNPAPKPRIKVAAPSSPSVMSLAEILRSYGHVQQVPA